MVLALLLAVGSLVAAEKSQSPSTAVTAGGDDGYLRYAHPTIREPFTDLLNLPVPAELENQKLAALGHVDVTRRPFD